MEREPNIGSAPRDIGIHIQNDDLAASSVIQTIGKIQIEIQTGRLSHIPACGNSGGVGASPV